MNKGWWIVKCSLAALVALLVVGEVTKLLWNWLIPTLFNGPVITYWQALGLLGLSKILTWGFTRRSYYGGFGHQPQTPYWKQRFQEKFQTLNPTEREAFKQKMKEKWCGWDKRSQTTSVPPEEKTID
jgi:hypothetical protein